MNFKRMFGKKESREEKILGGLLDNAFKSVEFLMTVPLFQKLPGTSTERLRCRLILYSMNVGILNYLITRKFSTDASLYVFNLRKHLLEIISRADPKIIEWFDNLVLNKGLVSQIREQEMQNGISVLTNKDLLDNYLFVKSKEYHFAVEEKIETMISSDVNLVDPNLIVDQVSKIFCLDYFGDDYMNHYEFCADFTLNVSTNLITVFDDDFKRFAA